MLATIRSYFSKLFAGDLSAFGGPSVEETIAGRIRVEQLTLVLRHSPGMMLANACNALVLAMALWNSHDGIFASIWASVVIVSSTLAGLKARASWRISKPLFVSRGAIRRLVRNAFILGSMWAVVPTCFFANATNGGQLVITCLCAGMLAGGAFAFATIPVAAIAVIAPIILGTAICLGQGGDFAYLLVAVLVVVYACVLLRGVFAHSFEFARRLIAHLEAEKVVRQDALTHLPNRLAFNEDLEEALARLARLDEAFAVLMLDLDGFKGVNDQFGHPAGDDFLIQVGARLRRCMREVDTVARIGGDEFAVIAANVTKPAEVLEIAERLVAAFAALSYRRTRDR
jgi:diguanylate cyclase (GGDEF)-like protein